MKQVKVGKKKANNSQLRALRVPTKVKEVIRVVEEPRAKVKAMSGKSRIPENAGVRKFIENGQKPSAAGVALRGLGSMGAGALGSYFGVPPSLSAPIGSALGAGVSRFLGMGDYEISANSLIKPGASHLNSSTVVMGPDGRRGVRVQEREFIGNVVSSTTFTNTAYFINPANSATFPWLSTLAQNFDEWEPHGIAFTFKSTSAAFNGANQALGVVIGATDYDPADPDYPTKLEMESSDYCVSSKACDDFVHLIECDPKERGRIVMKTLAVATPPTGTSVMDYHLGKFEIATDGQSTAGQIIGELWVSYDITFYKKQLHGGQVGNNVLTSVQYWSTIPVGFSNSTPFGNSTSVPETTNGTLQVQLSTAGDKFRLNGVSAGVYEIRYDISAIGDPYILTTVCTWTAVGAVSLVGSTYLAPGAANGVGNTSTIGTAERLDFVSYWRVTAPNPVWTLLLTLDASGTVLNTRLIVTQINGLATLPAYAPISRAVF
jgi:hypothetical protein